MYSTVAILLGTIYTLSEIGLSIVKRANSKESRLFDRGSLTLLWIVIMVSVTFAFSVSYSLPEAGLGELTQPARLLGTVLFTAGLIIRWYAIIYLGRFFTVDVAIAKDHRLIDAGPYRLVRHPSYTGALMAFLGLGLSIGNWASLVTLTVPTFVVFLWRMRVEESALLQGLGIQYRDYMHRTKRLIPAVY
jgi:protein-S-isoprenylcysteine O-methyltransferase